MIIQIVPAGPNWWVYYPDPETGRRGFECPVALWALVEDQHGHRSIQGVDPTGEGWIGDEITQDCEFVYRPEGPPAPDVWNQGPVIPEPPKPS